jgi:chemotaxis protein MotB
LNRKISELEAQVAEARQNPPVVLVADDLKEPDVLPTNRENAEVKRLPIINRPGVTVRSDELQRVRIAVMDKSLFMSNSWQLSEEGEETLRAIAAEIRAFNPKVDVDIEGHTDSLMNDPKNPMQKHDISTTKAKTVMDFFVTTLRWNAAQIGMSSFGRSRPVADNGTPEGRARNSRVEIVLRDRGE